MPQPYRGLSGTINDEESRPLKGSQFLDTGVVFAPYIPLIMTPLVYDPDTFTPRKGLLTRYAKKMIRPEFYGRVFVSNTALI